MIMRLGFVVALLTFFLMCNGTSYAQTSNSTVATSSSAAAAAPSSTDKPIKKVSLAELKRKDAEVDWFGRIRSAFGLLIMVLIAFLISSKKKHVSWRLVVIGIGIQVTLGMIALSPPGYLFFDFFNGVVTQLLNFTAEGSTFLFGNLAVQNNVPVGPSVIPMGEEATAAWIGNAKMGPVASPKGPWMWAPIGAYFAFGVLPTIIFFSSFMAVLYHIGVMQFLVRIIAQVMQKTMKTSGSETLSAAGNIFVGQTEAPLLVRPFVKGMTESELMAIMTGGFATVAGGVMVAYVGILQGVFPDIAGHLLCASIMSAPAALVIAKVIIPEVDPTKSETFGSLKLDLKSEDANVIDAAARGAGEGLKLALNVGAMLLAFIALIAMFNGLIGWGFSLIGFEGVSLQQILGTLLAPLAWVMGVPWVDCQAVGSLLGMKTVLNEFFAYLQLGGMASELEHRSLVISVYALCGFANFSSIAVQIGGIAPMAPERRSDLAKIGLRAMIGGTLAAFMTACVIGIMT